MVFGQCEVEQRVRRLIFNSAPTALSWAHTWTKAFFPVHLLREAGSSSQLSAILPGRARPRLGGLGGRGVWTRKGDGRGEQADLGQSPPRSPRAARASWEGGGPAPQRAALPACSSWEDTSATEKGSGGKHRAGLLTPRRQSPASRQRLPGASRPLGSRHTLRERKPWPGCELQLCPRRKPLTKPEFGQTPGGGDGQGGLRAAVHGVAKSRTRLSDWTELN